MAKTKNINKGKHNLCIFYWKHQALATAKKLQICQRRKSDGLIELIKGKSANESVPVEVGGDIQAPAGSTHSSCHFLHFFKRGNHSDACRDLKQGLENICSLVQ